VDVPARLIAASLAPVLTLLLAAPAPAQTPGSTGTLQPDPNALTPALDLNEPPVGHRLSAKQAIAIADRVEKVQRQKRRVPGATASAYLKGATRWQVSYYTPRGRREIAQVSIDDLTGQVLEAWTGYQVAWTMARGYRGAFGRKVNAPYVWIPLCLLFVVPFLDPRRPFRWLHLDLLVLVGFSISLYFFNRARIGLSVPLAYPPLLYLLARMLAIGLRRSEQPREPLRLLVPATWLAVAAVFLLGFRIGLNVTNSNVIDVGYAGVIGADRIADGERLYGDFPHDNEHGDTYGPVNYVAYIPFEQAKPWGGAWDDLPAAHGAAIAFDVLVVAALWLLGRRVRGPTLGVVLAYAWLAFPFSLYVLDTNANDALVAALILAAVLVATSAPARGALAGLASMAKFAPVALAPLLATYRGGRRGVLLFALAFAAAAAVAMIPALLHGGSLHTFYDRTIAYQNERESPFSIWGLWGGLDAVQTGVKIAALGLAVVLALVPRRRDVVGLAALCAAVLIALQLGVTHWFYLYIGWFAPLVFVALFARYREPAPAPAAAS
jgi:hypothetical protein